MEKQEIAAQKIQQQTQTPIYQKAVLPIAKHEQQIINGIDNGRTFVISGKTGCGKSTQVPKFIIRKYKYAKIAICEPRRLAAIALSYRVSQQLGNSVGNLVGYQIGMQSKISQNTQIKFMTYGILIQELLFNQDISYTHIILDEVHQRSLEMDFTFIALRKILDKKQMKHIKLIIMSATINSQLFCSYFSVDKQTGNYIHPTIKYSQSKPKTNNRRGTRNRYRKDSDEQNFQAQIISNHERGQKTKALDLPDTNKYKIVQYYVDNLPSKIYKKIKNRGLRFPSYQMDEDIRISDHSFIIAINIIQQYLGLKQWDILVFVPGMQQIKMLKTMLQQQLKVNYNNIIQVHSAYSENLYSKLFSSSQNSKIIIATNIGQSSITLPSCKVVIDFCLNRKNIGSNSKGFTSFETRIASRANLLQRAGRVGRTSDGQVYRLISSKQYKDLSDYDLPQIKCVTLQMVILKAKQIDQTCRSTLFQDPYDVFLNAIEPPKLQDIHRAIKQLIKQEALKICDRKSQKQKKNIKLFDGQSLKLTQIGQFMVSMPCSIRISKMIILSLQFNIQKTMVGIAAILMCQKKFFIPEQNMPNIEQFLHSLVGYDKGNYNDYLLRQRMFSHWKTTWFDGWMKKRAKNEKSGKKNRYENQIIEQFCANKITKQERYWCQDRGVSHNTMRQILRIYIDLKDRISKNFDQTNRQISNNQVPNQLVLLCLSLAFQDTTCSITWKQRNAAKNKNNNQNVISIIKSPQTNQDEILDYIYPEQDIKIDETDGGFIKITGSMSVLSKFLLPIYYNKASLQHTSNLFKYLNQTPSKVSYKYEPADISQRFKQMFILNTSINKFLIRPNINEQYMLISNQIFSSKGRNYIGQCALIQKKKLILIKMMTTKNVVIELHISEQFIHYVKIGNDQIQLPLFISSKDINLINQIRGFSLWEKSERMSKNNIGQQATQTKTNVMKLFRDIKIKPQTQLWNAIYNQIMYKTNTDRTKPISLSQFDQKLPQKILYFENYRKWKKKQHQQLYYNFRIMTIKNSVIICSTCHKKGEITVIDDLRVFDCQNKNLPLNQYRGSFKIQKDKIYCVKMHQIGLKVNNDIGELQNQKILMYGPYDRIEMFKADKQAIQNFISYQEDGKRQLQKQQRQIEQFSCKMCAKDIDYEGVRPFVLYSYGDYKKFWRQIQKHMFSKSHVENVDKFLSN